MREPRQPKCQHRSLSTSLISSDYLELYPVLRLCNLEVPMKQSSKLINILQQNAVNLRRFKSVVHDAVFNSEGNAQW